MGEKIRNENRKRSIEDGSDRRGKTGARRMERNMEILERLEPSEKDDGENQAHGEPCDVKEDWK